ncbi:hypothetical protein KUCAC02_022981, partial [Chaenocephalus aceratus]
TREEIEESTVNPQKRIRVPKIHHEEGVMEENNEGTSAEKDGLKKKTKAIKAAEVGEKRKSLMQILNEKKSLKNKNPLYTIEKKRKREETLPDSFSDSDNDDGECFRGWLIKQNVEKTEREKREKLAGYFISQKIQDL